MWQQYLGQVIGVAKEDVFVIRRFILVIGEAVRKKSGNDRFREKLDFLVSCRVLKDFGSQHQNKQLVER